MPASQHPHLQAEAWTFSPGSRFFEQSDEADELLDDLLIPRRLRGGDHSLVMQQDSCPRAIRARQMQSRAASFGTYFS